LCAKHTIGESSGYRGSRGIEDDDEVCLRRSLLIGSNASASATDRSFGDSLTNTDGQPVACYVSALNNELETTFNNFAVPGSMVGDQTQAVLGIDVAAGDRSTIMLGANDERHYGVDSVKQATIVTACAT
jgi:hypothetical protein